MPNYDYKCSSCGEITEKFHGMSESPEVLCPKCGAVSEKMIGAGAGIVFKGSGFYVTDYKKKESGKKAKTTTNKKSNDTSKTPGKPSKTTT